MEVAHIREPPTIHLAICCFVSLEERIPSVRGEKPITKYRYGSNPFFIQREYYKPTYSFGFRWDLRHE